MFLEAVMLLQEPALRRANSLFGIRHPDVIASVAVANGQAIRSDSACQHSGCHYSGGAAAKTDWAKVKIVLRLS